MHEPEEVKIEKGIPFPISRKRKTFPLEKMEIMDSFVVEVELRSLLYRSIARLAPKRFVTRTVKEGSHATIRVWRVV